MPPQSSIVLNSVHIETSFFLDFNSSVQTNMIESNIAKPTIIVIHGRKYDVSNFNHPGKLKNSFVERYESQTCFYKLLLLSLIINAMLKLILMF